MIESHKPKTSRAYFFRVHDKTTCCRLEGSHTVEGESLEDAIRQLPPSWVPWEALRERGNQLERLSNQEIINANQAAGRYNR